MLRCLANRLLGQAGRVPKLVLDRDARLAMPPRVMAQQAAKRGRGRSSARNGDVTTCPGGTKKLH